MNISISCFLATLGVLGVNAQLSPISPRHLRSVSAIKKADSNDPAGLEFGVDPSGSESMSMMSMSLVDSLIAGGESPKSSKSSKSGKSSKSVTHAPTISPPPLEGLISSWVQYIGSDNESCTLDNPSDQSCHFNAEVRAIFNDTDSIMTDCPSDALQINGVDEPMKVRVTARDNFTNIVCYAKLPMEEEDMRIVLGGRKLPVPVRNPQKVVVIGDSGCRLGTAHHGLYQSCNNPSLWPFKRVAESVRESKPDLIIHTGDYIYREGPCVVGFDGKEISGCAGSPFYDSATGVAENFAVWYADWFGPGESINQAAALVFTRGNHETCNRAGTGFFRYLFHGSNATCIDSPSLELEPWVAAFENLQIGVMDSSTRPNASDPINIQEYADQLDLLGDFVSKPAFFLSHYPFFGWGATDDDITGEDPGTVIIEESMIDVARNTASGGVPSSFGLCMAAHIHLAEVVSFVGGEQPPQLVVANTGTQLIAMTDPPAEINNVEVKETTAVYQYGFVLLTKKEGKKEEGNLWWMDFKDRRGRTLVSCDTDLEKKDVTCPK